MPLTRLKNVTSAEVIEWIEYLLANQGQFNCVRAQEVYKKVSLQTSEAYRGSGCRQGTEWSSTVTYFQSRTLQ